MPQSVLGGAAVMMFSSIIVSGIQLITKEPLDARRLSIVSVALGVGYGMGVSPAILEHTPQAVQLMFGESGIAPAASVSYIFFIMMIRYADFPTRKMLVLHVYFLQNITMSF